MAKKCGRPAKSADYADTKQRIIDTTIDLIRKKGADYITVRNVCAAANLSIGTFYHYFRDKDELLMYFVRDTSFETCSLQTPINKIGDRVSELYMRLINRYMEFGLEFMKSFYTTGNKALSAYMGQENGCFADGTVMARCERELIDAREQGFLKKDADPRQLSMDICTIVKGCVFEWALDDGRMDIAESLRRIVKAYLENYK